MTTAERFWAKVDTSGGLFACWEWQGNRNDRGYGAFWFDGVAVES